MSAKIVEFSQKRLRSSASDLCPKVQAEREKAEVRALVAARADPSAVWDLADLHVPTDVRSFSALFFRPGLAARIWRSAFVAGWRAADRSKTVKDPKNRST
jgi:hypothetical protein